ncbi:MAG TPA: winged helix-turn-helix transcriptional regulator [Candidatus Thermoplasmatota archaeon]|nr:winged helix-turn-helix transcriptional regulator [Candidatus Thermoplasmatota archaeon]
MQLDRLDVGILRLLQQDARLSFRQLAERLGSTTPTVSARVKALEELGVLRGYRAEVDAGLLGGHAFHLAVRGPPAALERLARAVAEAPGVEEVAILAGGVVHARARLRPPAQSLADLHAALARLPDVASYDVAEVLAVTHRVASAPLPDELDVRCHQCGGPIHGEPHQKAFEGRAHVFCCKGCLATFAKRVEKLRGAT